MQRLLSMLLFLILPLFLFPGEPDCFSARSDLREFRVSPGAVSDAGKPPPHPALNSIRYAFYPPRREEALYIRPASDPAELRLIFSGAGEEQILRLPATADNRLIEILLPHSLELSALVLPLDGGFFFECPPGSILGTIDTDRPDQLVLSMPGPHPSADHKADVETTASSTGEDTPALPEDKAEGRSGQDLVLTLRNPGPVRIEGGGEYSAVLRSHNRQRSFHFSTYPGDEWTISPLSQLDFLSSDIEPRPEFPEPLKREGMQILNADPVLWRNREFEIYRWSSLPEVLIFDCLNYEVQNRFFRRLAYFVEKKGYRGLILSHEELKGKHAWNAHDYRASDLADFFNKTEELGTDLYKEELFLKDLLVREGILVRDAELFRAGVGAVNSMALESGPGLRYRFFTHEASHGIYFTQKKYRDFVKGFWDSLEDGERDLWRLYMSWNAYDPGDEDLMMNELQAYCTQQPVSEAADYFMVRMRRVAERSPGFGELFYQMEESLPGRFRRWAERVEAFQRENWGLEAGNFSPLQGEWPPENE